MTSRRAIYLLVALAVVVPIMLNTPLACSPSEPTLRVLRWADSLPPGSLVWFGYDGWASSAAEIAPSAVVVSRHLLSRGCRLVVTSTVPDGALLMRRYVGEVARELHKQYGVDYVLLGYRPGDMKAIRQMSGNMSTAFRTDQNGTPLNQIPIMKGVTDATAFAGIFTATDNKTFEWYPIVVKSRYNVPVYGASTAVGVPELYSYYNSGQISGLIAGLRGAAEYETLRHEPGNAEAGMLAQSVVHALVCGLILLSNALYFGRRRWSS